MKSIYDLALHEQEHAKDQNFFVMRVPGGWFYVWGEDDAVGVFVPFSNEFKRPRVGKKVASATPLEFRDVLLGIARSVTPARFSV